LARKRKLDVPVSGSGEFSFDSFRVKSRKDLNLKFIRFKGVLSMEKGAKVSRDQDRRNLSLKLKSQKPDVLVWDSGWSGFPRTD
jgi:hypothetical protein